MKLTRKDFQTKNDVRWCPGCGDYAILATVQRLMPDLGVKREDMVFVSGIGCAARFPYYMETYGMHTIHGHAPAVATGLKMTRPELMVWVISGDGDSLAIGGNHTLHLIRRNVDIKVLNPDGDLDKTTVDVNRFHVELAGNPLDLSAHVRTPISPAHGRGRGAEQRPARPL